MADLATITIKMDKHLLHDIDSSLAANRYATRSEFIRDAVRRKLTEQEKEEAIRKLESLRGSLKGKARMSEERARDETWRHFAKKFNLPSE